MLLPFQRFLGAMGNKKPLETVQGSFLAHPVHRSKSTVLIRSLRASAQRFTSSVTRAGAWVPLAISLKLAYLLLIWPHAVMSQNPSPTPTPPPPQRTGKSYSSEIPGRKPPPATRRPSRRSPSLISPKQAGSVSDASRRLRQINICSKRWAGARECSISTTTDGWTFFSPTPPL